MAILFNSRERTPARYFCTFRQAGCSAGARRSLRHDCLGHEIRKAVGRSGYRNGNIRHRPATRSRSRGGGAAAAVFIGYAQCHDGRDGQSGDIDLGRPHRPETLHRRPSIFGRASRARRCFDRYRFRASMLRERTRLRPCRLSESRAVGRSRPPCTRAILQPLSQGTWLESLRTIRKPAAVSPDCRPLRLRRRLTFQATHRARNLLPIEHPNHMPVTRDLSPAKREMLLRFFSQLDRGDASRSMPASTAPAAAATPAPARAGKAAAARGGELGGKTAAAARVARTGADRSEPLARLLAAKLAKSRGR